jgi:single-stranded DNA-binding protein
MQTRSWEQNGEKKYRTEVVADLIQFGPRSSEAKRNPVTGEDQDEVDGQDDIPTESGPGIEYPKDDIDPDDIPF